MTIKKISKIVVALILIATILSGVSMVFAQSTGSIDIPSGTNTGYTDTGLSGSVSRVLGIVQFICYAAAVVLIVILGVKFMTASPEGKAEIKKSAVIYVIGAVIVFAAGVILQIIRKISTQTINNNDN